MKKREDLMQVVGIVLVGAMLAGCFVPVVYGAYKVYEDANMLKITINVKEKPAVVFAKAAAEIEEKGKWNITERNDEKMVLDVKKGEQEGYLKVSLLAGGKTSSMTIAVEKGEDPKAQKEQLVQSVLGACSKLGLECTEEKK